MDNNCPIHYTQNMAGSLIETPRLSPRSQAVHTLTQWMNDGRFSPGARLPGEEHLAEALQVARGTVRQALRQLVDQGLLAKEPNRGHTVVGTTSNGGLLSHAFLLLGDTRQHLTEIAGYGQALNLAVVRRLHTLGHHVIHIAPDRVDERLTAELRREPPRGIIAGFEACVEPKALERLLAWRAQGLPVAAATESTDANTLDRAISDHRGATAELVRRLAERGRRRILRVWTLDPPLPWLSERDAGYAAGCAAAGLTTLPPLLALEPFERSESFDRDIFMRRSRIFAGYLVEQLRSANRPDALLTITDSDAVAITAACRLCGLDPATDIDVVGYDGYWAQTWERALEPLPPVFSVDKHNTAIGEALVDLVIERVRNPPRPSELRRIAPAIQLLR